MTNVTVQEALNVVEQALLNAIAVMENKTELTTTQRESRKAAAITQCKNALMELEYKSALSEIEKCEPVYQVFSYHSGGWIEVNKHQYDDVDEIGKRTLYTSPQPIEKCEPVGELSVDYQGFSSYKSLKDLPNGYHKLHTSPQPRKTDEEDN